MEALQFLKEGALGLKSGEKEVEILGDVLKPHRSYPQCMFVGGGEHLFLGGQVMEMLRHCNSWCSGTIPH